MSRIVTAAEVEIGMILKWSGTFVVIDIREGGLVLDLVKIADNGDKHNLGGVIVGYQFLGEPRLIKPDARLERIAAVAMLGGDVKDLLI